MLENEIIEISYDELHNKSKNWLKTCDILGINPYILRDGRNGEVKLKITKGEKEYLLND